MDLNWLYFRKHSVKTMFIMVLWLYPWYLEVIRRRRLLQLVIMSITRYICQSATFTTMFDELIETPLRLLDSSPLQRVSTNAWLIWTNVSFIAADRQYKDNSLYRRFRRQLMQSTLEQILNRLKPGMTTPEIMRCPDGHYRRVVFCLGPYIADYPEQALIANIVNGWCPK
jgi:hypothetical protein